MPCASSGERTTRADRAASPGGVELEARPSRRGTYDAVMARLVCLAPAAVDFGGDGDGSRTPAWGRRSERDRDAASSHRACAVLRGTFRHDAGPRHGAPRGTMRDEETSDAVRAGILQIKQR